MSLSFSTARASAPLLSFGPAFRVNDERPYDGGFLRIYLSQAGLKPGAS
jgi:hypothetical protein